MTACFLLHLHRWEVKHRTNNNQNDAGQESVMGFVVDGQRTAMHSFINDFGEAPWHQVGQNHRHVSSTGIQEEPRI